MTPAALPLLDEHAVAVHAPPATVWVALLATLDRSFGRNVAAAYARAVGCEPVATSGPRPLIVGFTFPGFGVTGCVPDRELVLEGRHRFSTYALTFRLQPSGAGCRLTAESRAVFPGLTGRAYRLLVLRTGAHVVGVHGLLAGVRRQAERTQPGSKLCTGTSEDGTGPPAETGTGVRGSGMTARGSSRPC